MRFCYLAYRIGEQPQFIGAISPEPMLLVLKTMIVGESSVQRLDSIPIT